MQWESWWHVCNGKTGGMVSGRVSLAATPAAAADGSSVITADVAVTGKVTVVDARASVESASSRDTQPLTFGQPVPETLSLSQEKTARVVITFTVQQGSGEGFAPHQVPPPPPPPVSALPPPAALKARIVYDISLQPQQMGSDRAPAGRRMGDGWSAPPPALCPVDWRSLAELLAALTGIGASLRCLLSRGGLAASEREALDLLTAPGLRQQPRTPRCGDGGVPIRAGPRAGGHWFSAGCGRPWCGRCTWVLERRLSSAPSPATKATTAPSLPRRTSPSRCAPRD